MKTNPEIEITFYAKMQNPAGLQEADEIEEHDQLETRLLKEGSKIRVRRTIKDGASTLEFTAKITNENQSSENEDKIRDTMEYNCPVNEEYFDTFLKAVAEQRMKKTRYYFKNNSITIRIGEAVEPIVIEHVGFEVDLFHTRGEAVPYVKIDVEVDPILAYVKEHFPDVESIMKISVKTLNLPFKPVSMIYKPEATEEEKNIVEDLWANHYTLRREEFPTLTI